MEKYNSGSIALKDYNVSGKQTHLTLITRQSYLPIMAHKQSLNV
jgi:hypothetical protein